jgi:hypothetical protein
MDGEAIRNKKWDEWDTMEYFAITRPLPYAFPLDV